MPQGDRGQGWRICWLLWVAFPNPATADQGYWNAGFSLPGVRGEVRAMASNSRELYVSGRFTAVGSVVATHLAKWNGSQWTALPGLCNGEVNALALRDGTVYAGGTFTQVGGAPNSQVSAWKWRKPHFHPKWYPVWDGGFMESSHSALRGALGP